MKEDLLGIIEAEIQREIGLYKNPLYNRALDRIKNHIELTTVDSVALRSIELFYDPKEGLPGGLYKGFDDWNVKHLALEQIRLVKSGLKELCKGKHKESLLAVSTITKTILMELIIDLKKISGVDDLIIKLYLHSVIEFTSHYAWQTICQALIDN